MHLPCEAREAGTTYGLLKAASDSMLSHRETAGAPGSLQVKAMLLPELEERSSSPSYREFYFLLTTSAATRLPCLLHPQHRSISKAQELLTHLHPVPPWDHQLYS